MVVTSGGGTETCVGTWNVPSGSTQACSLCDNLTNLVHGILYFLYVVLRLLKIKLKTRSHIPVTQVYSLNPLTESFLYTWERKALHTSSEGTFLLRSESLKSKPRACKYHAEE